jgi:hypothetical protein
MRSCSAAWAGAAANKISNAITHLQDEVERRKAWRSECSKFIRQSTQVIMDKGVLAHEMPSRYTTADVEVF